MSKLTKRDKDTEIYYNQTNAPMLIRTHDQKLIRRLTALAVDFPELCRLTEEDEICGSYFEVDKRRISIHVTRPYSEERRKKQSEWAKENGLTGN
ncbi:MAG: molecular chaperone [Clostridiales bacterium]|nr:molecular chaperone [Clostridiales bacterium]MCD8368688.1 molecular chaperone [Clostridiales bacterium]